MNEQERFWAGKFGTDYCQRNNTGKLLESNMVMFADIIPQCRGISTVLECGCNIGLNLEAIHLVNPALHLSGFDINPEAVKIANRLDYAYVYESSFADFYTDEKFDLVFTKGVLIHIHPDNLQATYKKMFDLSSKYILVAEYYNTKPVGIDYRGEQWKLWKRDFAGDLMEHFGVRLVDYGFVYHRGLYPQDDISWFLLTKE